MPGHPSRKAATLPGSARRKCGRFPEPHRRQPRGVRMKRQVWWSGENLVTRVINRSAESNEKNPLEPRVARPMTRTSLPATPSESRLFFQSKWRNGGGAKLFSYVPHLIRRKSGSANELKLFSFFGRERR